MPVEKLINEPRMKTATGRINLGVESLSKSTKYLEVPSSLITALRLQARSKITTVMIIVFQPFTHVLIASLTSKILRQTPMTIATMLASNAA